MSDAPTTVNEYDAIRATLQHYLDGARSGRGDDMKPAFHDDAAIFGLVGPDRIAGPIQALYDWNDENGPAETMEARIASVEITGTIATARIEIDDWTGHRFTDVFSLLKIDGRWKIVCKVFHLHG